MQKKTLFHNVDMLVFPGQCPGIMGTPGFFELSELIRGEIQAKGGEHTGKSLGAELSKNALVWEFVIRGEIDKTDQE